MLSSALTTGVRLPGIRDLVITAIRSCESKTVDQTTVGDLADLLAWLLAALSFGFEYHQVVVRVLD